MIINEVQYMEILFCTRDQAIIFFGGNGSIVFPFRGMFPTCFDYKKNIWDIYHGFERSLLTSIEYHLSQAHSGYQQFFVKV